MAFTKFAALEQTEVLGIKGSEEKVRVASLDRFSDFENYKTSDGYLYVRLKAQSSRVNKNHDGWPSVELAGGPDAWKNYTQNGKTSSVTIHASDEATYGFSTFLHKPVFVDHNNSDPSRARGVIVDAKLHIEDTKTSSHDPYYSSRDVDPEHLPPTWIELLVEVDAKSFPRLAKAIVEGGSNPDKGIDGWSMGCFVAGTPITLSDGTQKPIEDIQVDDRVLTHTGKVESVTYTMKRPHQGLIYDIETYGQAERLRLTEEHPVWIRRNANTVRGKGKVQGGTCKCGQTFSTRASFGAHLREAKRWNKLGHDRQDTIFEGWCEAKDIREGDMVLTPMPEGIGHPGSYPFARLLGYYLAEGNAGYDRKRYADGRPVSVEWNFHEDEIEYIQEVLMLLESLGYKGVGPYVKSTCATVRCNSAELAARFVTYGGKYSWNKSLDQEVLRWEPSNQKALLDAYFAGDASRNTDEHVEISTASKKLADQLQLLATRVGYRMTPAIEQHSPSMKAAGHRPRYSMQALKVEPSTKAAARSFIDSQGLWRRVEHISMKDFQGHVYNFDVDGDDSYVASDVAVHNCNVEKTKCSICSNVASEPEDFCKHVKLKGAHFDTFDKLGRKVSRKAYENCYGCQYFEISAVFDPADETALTREVRSSVQKEASFLKGAPDAGDDQYFGGKPGASRKAYDSIIEEYGDEKGEQVYYALRNKKKKSGWEFGKLADNPAPQKDLLSAPDHVDTLRSDDACPLCGSEMDGPKCKVCDYSKPPDGFDNPDLTKLHPEIDAERRGEPQKEEEEDPVTQAEGSPLTSEIGPAQDNATNVMASAQVKNDMSGWNLTVHPKVAGRINVTERPIKPQGPISGEPTEVVLSDPTQPIQTRTASDIIAAAQKETEMKVADAASGAPAAAEPAGPGGQPGVRGDVEGVGGYVDDSNEEASKPTGRHGEGGATVDVEAIGGTGVEDVDADEQDHVDHGDEYTKTTDGSGPTKTWGQGTGVEHQESPVSREPFPASDEGVKKSNERTAYDSEPFPHHEDDGGLSQDSGAVKGNKPVAEQFGDRVDVLQPLTSPENNSGETKTWSGTDGNKVNRQQDPVTKDSLEGNDIVNLHSSRHLFAAFKLADTEVDLGLIEKADKYNRVAELQELTPAELDAEARVVARVRTSGIRRTATKQGGVGRLPSMRQPVQQKEASTETTEADEALFW